jgi:hypothetical protein
MNLIILFFSLVTSPLLKYTFNKTVNDIYSGCDERYPIRENNMTENINQFILSDEDILLIAKIRKYFLYKDFLRTLENDKISIQDKLRIIENNDLLNIDDNASSKYTTNLLAGGLMDDFNFEL